MSHCHTVLVFQPLFVVPSRFRQICQSIIAHKLFDYVVLAFIFSNCITVALERPKILQGSLVNQNSVCVYVGTTFVFTEEGFSFIY